MAVVGEKSKKIIKRISPITYPAHSLSISSKGFPLEISPPKNIYAVFLSGGGGRQGIKNDLFIIR